MILNGQETIFSVHRVLRAPPCKSTCDHDQCITFFQEHRLEILSVVDDAVTVRWCNNFIYNDVL